MSNLNTWSLLPMLLAGIVATGCEYHDCDDDHDPFCDEDEDEDEGGNKRRSSNDCSNACGRLVACGHIDRSARAQCEQSCAGAMARNDFGTKLFCRCAEETSCSALTDECGPVPPALIPPPPAAPTPPTAPPNPPPPPAAAPDAGAPDAGPIMCSRDGGATPGCRSDGECASVEACVEGVCRARCQAPCDCRIGDACTDGVCIPSTTPSVCSLLVQ